MLDKLIAAEVLEKALPYLGIAPQYTEDEQQRLFAAVPDFSGRGIAYAKAALGELGFAAAVQGSAFVARAAEITRRNG